LLGHLYRIVASYMIYQGVFAGSVTHPYVQLADTGEKLRVAMTERQRAYRDLQERASRDVADHKRTEEEIRKLNQELEQRVLDLRNANCELDTFNSTVSHDLGIPLMIIEGFTQRLAKTYGPDLDRTFSDFVEIIHANVMKMEQLIHDLLAYARLGRQAMQRVPVSVHEVVTSVIDELREIYPEEKAMILPVPPCCGDEHMIREVFANLISNALKFSIRSTERIVEIGGWETPKENVYFVKDYGVGFDMQQKEKLFNVFQRLHPQEEFEGTGMGLAIVKRIIGLHGGRVWAESKPCEGATFYVTLPRPF